MDSIHRDRKADTDTFIYTAVNSCDSEWLVFLMTSKCHCCAPRHRSHTSDLRKVIYPFQLSKIFQCDGKKNVMLVWGGELNCNNIVNLTTKAMTGLFLFSVIDKQSFLRGKLHSCGSRSLTWRKKHSFSDMHDS